MSTNLLSLPSLATSMSTINTAFSQVKARDTGKGWQAAVENMAHFSRKLRWLVHAFTCPTSIEVAVAHSTPRPIPLLITGSTVLERVQWLNYSSEKCCTIGALKALHFSSTSFVNCSTCHVLLISKCAVILLPI